MKTKFTAAAAVAVALGIATQASADTKITISNWISPKHPVSAAGYHPFIEKLEASGFKVSAFEGGALLGAKPALPGIGDGVADMGMLAMTYFPAEFPNAQLVADMGLSTPNSLTAMAAAAEYNLLHCPECLAEYKAANVVYMGTYSSSPYSIISKEPIRSTADLKGKKMRVPGSLWSRWAESVGGIQVNVPSSEMFEGLDKGALDIAIQSPGALRSYALWDTAKYVNNLNLGTYHSLSLMTMNRDFWADLSDEERALILGEAAKMSVDVTEYYLNSEEEVIALMDEHGVEMIDASAEMVDTKAQFVAGDVTAIIDTAKTKYGIADAEAKVAKLNELMAKWSGIVAETGGDRDAMIARLQSEVYDKLPAGFGLN
ncbi:C4-dicarboxylate TRAP transporter substrate-binding protein [Thalassovita taeanensis]|uniref:TRAP-type C4-dicarboxylate transport system, substrate-binding protein n=1 Tax=Thalassovita taeanensis TaxID=657014 RepID=A0A1H9H9I5_9RHOB|nr:C4-dicarboxylate TRAP transporter substrate-binding protein [Thalassovita taeanensis]SEQ58992.1 TRAP-type C4-dicarboxylate transport system, substrate-binding protein [Thalassovita taeanensis]